MACHTNVTMLVGQYVANKFRHTCKCLCPSGTRAVTHTYILCMFYIFFIYINDTCVNVSVCNYVVRVCLVYWMVGCRDEICVYYILVLNDSTCCSDSNSSCVVVVGVKQKFTFMTLYWLAFSVIKISPVTVTPDTHLQKVCVYVQVNEGKNVYVLAQPHTY